MGNSCQQIPKKRRISLTNDFKDINTNHICQQTSNYCFFQKPDLGIMPIKTKFQILKEQSLPTIPQDPGSPVIFPSFEKISQKEKQSKPQPSINTDIFKENADDDTFQSFSELYKFNTISVKYNQNQNSSKLRRKEFISQLINKYQNRKTNQSRNLKKENCSENSQNKFNQRHGNQQVQETKSKAKTLIISKFTIENELQKH